MGPLYIYRPLEDQGLFVSLKDHVASPFCFKRVLSEMYLGGLDLQKI